VLAVVVAIAAGAATSAGVTAFREYGSIVGTAVAMVFLLLMAALNASVLRGVLTLWRRMRRGGLDERELEHQLLNRGLLNRVFGGRARTLIRSSWHMFPVGLLFGLGLETASEITLLTLSASAATSGDLPVLAVLTLPVLFTAGMSAFDTADGLLMTRAYSWAFRDPVRRLFYNIATTTITVLVAIFVGTVYLAGLIVDHLHVGDWLAPYAKLGDHFQLLGYLIVGLFCLAWLLAAVIWRVGGFELKYGRARP
jgi:high-affinity nickel-transport protein